jgi:hypothetical protein
MIEVNKQSSIRIVTIKQEAAKKYVLETKGDMPSIGNSDVTIGDKSEIVILRDRQGETLAQYQLTNDNKFCRMDRKG